MHVPYVDLKRQYMTIKDEIDTAIQSAVDSCAFVSGEKVTKFEKNYAKYCGSKYAVGISNGTGALYVGLKALGIGKGDAVITVPFTFVATVEAISLTGARPVFVDIDKDSYNISIQKLKKYIREFCKWNLKERMLVDRKTSLKVKAIMPVHLYGQMSEMDSILEIANQHDLLVLEDAAQAHGATYKNRKAGTLGQIGCFSFYPSKNLGAFGQGGAVITDNEDLAERIRTFINHGQTEKYVYSFEGWNLRMDGLQAAILDVKLKYLDRWNEARRNHVHMYNELLKEINGATLPKEMPHCEHIYYLYVIRVKNRGSLHKYLQKAGVNATVAYPIPLHMQTAYQYLGYRKGDFPDAEECAETVLSLPIFPELTKPEIEYVCRNIDEWARLNSEI